MRVVSIFLASRISSSRVSSGIEPICERYIRTGSSMRRLLVSARASVSSFCRAASSSSSAPGWSSLSPEA